MDSKLRSEMHAFITLLGHVSIDATYVVAFLLSIDATYVVAFLLVFSQEVAFLLVYSEDGYYPLKVVAPVRILVYHTCTHSLEHLDMQHSQVAD